MNWKTFVPYCFVRCYYNWRAKRGHKGISIAHDVDLQNVTLSDFTNFAHHSQVSNSTIGKRTSIGRYTKIAYAHIGKYCSISWDVTIGAISHPMHSVSTHAFPFRKKFGLCDKDIPIDHEYVEIGNDVWIGCGAIIMPGVRIGDGAIVGGGGILTHSVADYEIVAGVPARHIGWRFDETTREKLLASEWWNLPDNTIKENIALFSPDIDITEKKEIVELLNKIRT